MQNLLTVPLAFVVVLAAFPATAGLQPGAAEAVRFDAHGVHLGEGPALAGAARNTQPECGATAPKETYCTTGLHAALVVHSVGLTPTPGADYTLEVRLFHAGPTTVFQVHFVDGEFAGAAAYGPFPTVGVFQHECFAYALGQAGTNALPLPGEANGTPGGAGAWSCMVNYDP